MREIFFDTETTGLALDNGNRIVEIGAVEYDDGKPTGRQFHEYVDPERDNEPGAEKVHGLSRAMLAGKPKWKDINEAFCGFVEGARLIAHNADYDTGFIVMEQERCRSPRLLWELVPNVVDSIAHFRKYDPGQKSYSLDHVMERFGIDASRRTNHGALLDAELLAETYYKVRSESKVQIFDYDAASAERGPEVALPPLKRPLRVVAPTVEETAADTGFHAADSKPVAAAGKPKP